MQPHNMTHIFCYQILKDCFGKKQDHNNNAKRIIVPYLIAAIYLTQLRLGPVNSGLYNVGTSAYERSLELEFLNYSSGNQFGNKD